MPQRLYLRFLYAKRRCAWKFRYLQHTSGERFRKCGENQDQSTRPRFCASATCGFNAENLVVHGGFRFFPALPEKATSIVRSSINRSSATTSSSSGNVKGPLAETRTTTLLCHRLTKSPRRLGYSLIFALDLAITHLLFQQVDQQKLSVLSLTRLRMSFNCF